MINAIRQMRFLEAASLLVILAHFHRALLWIGRTWQEATYESWGMLALLLLVPLFRRLPAPRPTPALRHLAGAAGLCLLDLILAPLALNILSAFLGLTALHLWSVAFRRFAGSWLLQRQLWLGLLCLPAVYWANVLFGYQLQSLASELAGRCLWLYGIPARIQGTVISVPGAVLAVDTSCSGLKLLYSGILFGVVATPGVKRGWRAILAFWGALLPMLLLGNVARVLCLAMGQLFLGRPVGEVPHQAIGLIIFALVCAIMLAVLALLGRRQRVGEVTP